MVNILQEIEHDFISAYFIHDELKLAVEKFIDVIEHDYAVGNIAYCATSDDEYFETIRLQDF